MKTKTITLYEYEELTDKAKERALREWNDDNDDPYMQSHMINLLKEELDERGIKYIEDNIDVRYSLSNCQGDGFMFEGELEWEKYTIYIKHSGHYYHSYSKSVEMQETDNLGFHIENDKDEQEFEELYQEICKKMEGIGYDYIEAYTSEEAFVEACEANGYTFRENGEMENA